MYPCGSCCRSIARTVLILLAVGVAVSPARGALEVSTIFPAHISDSRASTITMTGTEFEPGTQFTLIGSAAFPAGIVATGETCCYGWDLIVAGDVAYTTSLGLRIFDISDPTAPVEAGSFTMAPFPSFMALDSGVLSLISYYGTPPTFTRLDVSDPFAPTLISANPDPLSCDSTSGTGGVGIHGNVAYVTCGNSGVHVWNNGVFAGSVATTTGTSEALDVIVRGDLAYVADNERGLVILDLADPLNPTVIGALGTGEPYGMTVTLAGDIAWVAGGGEIAAVDISNPAAPTIRSTARAWHTYALDISEDNGLVYLMDFRIGPLIYDGSDPDNVRLIYEMNGLPTSGSLVVSGGYAYGLTLFTNGIHTYDISTPIPPGFAAGIAYSFYGSPLSTTPGLLHAPIATDYKLVDITSPDAWPIRGSLTLAYNARQMVTNGTLDYVVGDFGMEIVDTSDPDLPVVVGSLPLPPYSGDALAFSGTHLYAQQSGAGMQIIDVTDPTSPFLAGTFEDHPNVVRIKADGDLLIFYRDHDDPDDLFIYDISNPISPQLATSLVLPGYNIDLRGTQLLVASTDGLKNFDLTTPATPQLVGELGLPLEAFTVRLEGNTVRTIGRLGRDYPLPGGRGFTTGAYDYMVIDISDPTALQLVGGTGQGWYSGPTDGGYAYGRFDPDTVRGWRVHPPTSSTFTSPTEAGLDVAAGMSPGFYDLIALTPGGDFHRLHTAVQVLVDSDVDGLGDEDEILLGTDPSDPDSDGDGLLDGDEIVLGADPLNTDSDGDGIPDGDEVAQGTNPADADTDGDGVDDAEDVDPLVPDIIPPDVLCTVTPVSGQVQMNFSASDAQAATITSAVLSGGNPPGSCMGPPVKQDQIFNARCNDTCNTGFFSLEGPGLAFVVTATDPSGNVGTCIVPLCDQVEMDLDTDEAAAQDTVIWSGSMGASAFRVIRGNLGLPQSNPPAETAECMAQMDPEIQPQQVTMSAAALSPGSVEFYLVATENSQGAVSFGVDSEGAPRPVFSTTCPAGP